MCELSASFACFALMLQRFKLSKSKASNNSRLHFAKSRKSLPTQVRHQYLPDMPFVIKDILTDSGYSILDTGYIAFPRPTSITGITQKSTAKNRDA